MSDFPETSAQAWPLKAYKNLDFLSSDAARAIRVLCEFTEPGERFAAEEVADTIVLFGSARTRPPEVAQARLDKLKSELEDPANPSPAEKQALRLAERGVRFAPYYTAAVELAEALTRWSMGLPDGARRFLVCSGGGPGIMEAANRGAHLAGGKSVGLGISLPFEQSINEFVPDELKFEFHYFFVRKFWFVSMAKALIAFPGGFGTLDELFETLTLVQTKKVEEAPPIVLFGSEFWNEVINFEVLADWGVISEDDPKLFRILDTVEEARDFIIAELSQRFLNHPESLL